MVLELYWFESRRFPTVYTEGSAHIECAVFLFIPSSLSHMLHALRVWVLLKILSIFHHILHIRRPQINNLANFLVWEITALTVPSKDAIVINAVVCFGS